MRVTRDIECWRCHKLMNPLGNPFENFDHFGRWRAYETVLDAEATAANVNHKGEPQGDIFKRVAYDSTGDVDGHKVTGAVDMIHKLAKTALARQVWVRHAFRYFMGRNETADDVATLQAADAAYLQSDGSFETLLISLLASDSFLMRAQPKSS